MRLKAGCDLNIESENDTPLIAMLRPRSGQQQWVASEAYLLEPFTPVLEYTDGFGNLCQRLVAPKGKFRMRVDTIVETAEDIVTAPGAPATPIHELPVDTLQFLLQSRYCPSDQMEAKAREVAGKHRPGYDQVEAIRAFIQQNIAYKYGVSSAASDALDTLEAGAGVCRDFSHVGISLTRALTIPARMVVGWLYELDPMDMHAWFEAFVDGRWHTFDATQSRPRGGRIAVAYGRDAADVALFTEFAETKVANMKVWVERG
ncbi:MAG: transglutaminase protein [Myxococcaceae bacterium]|nr:transglutaminase protein [Myxococcaceae bacterium]